MYEKNYNQCVQLCERYLCKGNLPIHEVARHKTCESEVLLQPSIEAFRTCTIQMTHKPRPSWAAIRTLSAWLYSILSEILAEVECNVERRGIKLSGIGLIQLSAGCTLKTKETTLPGLTDKRGSSEILYEPAVHLEIEKLSPIIVQSQRSETPEELTSIPEIRVSKDDSFERNEETLDELERKMYETSSERRSRTMQNQLIHGAYAGLGILLLGLLLIPCHAKIMAIMLSLWTSTYKRTSTSREINQEINPDDVDSIEPNSSTPHKTTSTTTPAAASRTAPAPTASQPIVKLPMQTLLPM